MANLIQRKFRRGSYDSKYGGTLVAVEAAGEYFKGSLLVASNVAGRAERGLPNRRFVGIVAENVTVTAAQVAAGDKVVKIDRPDWTIVEGQTLTSNHLYKQIELADDDTLQDLAAATNIPAGTVIEIKAAGKIVVAWIYT